MIVEKLIMILPAMGKGKEFSYMEVNWAGQEKRNRTWRRGWRGDKKPQKQSHRKKFGDEACKNAAGKDCLIVVLEGQIVETSLRRLGSLAVRLHQTKRDARPL